MGVWGGGGTLKTTWCGGGKEGGRGEGRGGEGGDGGEGGGMSLPAMLTLAPLCADARGLGT